MPSYSYIAVDAMGKEKKATIDAENQDKAAARLKKNGLTLISIKEVICTQNPGHIFMN